MQLRDMGVLGIFMKRKQNTGQASRFGSYLEKKSIPYAEQS